MIWYLKHRFMVVFKCPMGCRCISLYEKFTDFLFDITAGAVDLQ